MNISRPTLKPVLPLGDPSDTPATMRVTSPYGQRGDSFHGGIDIGNYVAGDTLVACGAGVVTQVGYYGSVKPTDAWWNAQPAGPYTGQRGGLYGPPSKWDGPVWGGQQLDIDLGSGWFARYAHADTVTVTKGQRVALGAKLGTVGDTGSAYRQPHLHLGIHYAGTSVQGGWVDPWPLINGGPHPHLGEEDDMKLLPVQEDWNTVAGGEFYLEGPGVGPAKIFVTSERVRSIAESTEPGDNTWRLIAYKSGEVLWMQRSNLQPISGTRTPSTGYGPPVLADCSAQDATIAQLKSKIARANTANTGAMQAQTAVKVALG